MALTESEDTNKATTDIFSSSKKQNPLLSKASPVSQKKVELAEAVARAAQQSSNLTPAKEKPSIKPNGANLLPAAKKESPTKGAPGLSQKSAASANKPGSALKQGSLLAFIKK